MSTPDQQVGLALPLPTLHVPHPLHPLTLSPPPGGKSLRAVTHLADGRLPRREEQATRIAQKINPRHTTIFDSV